MQLTPKTALVMPKYFKLSKVKLPITRMRSLGVRLKRFIFGAEASDMMYKSTALLSSETN